MEASSPSWRVDEMWNQPAEDDRAEPQNKQVLAGILKSLSWSTVLTTLWTYVS